MGLLVDPAALVGYARQLDRALGDAAAIKGYIRKYAQDGTGGELYSMARDGHRRAVDMIDGSLARLTSLLEGSGPEVAAAVDTVTRRGVVGSGRAR